MNSAIAALEPAALDAWLRQHLGRRMTVVGLSLPATRPAAGWATVVLDDAPSLLVAALAEYGELWVLWAAAGATPRDALTDAATHDADVMLVWLPRPADGPTGGTLDSWAAEMVQTLVAEMDASGQRDRCVVALVGPGASRALARQLGCDDGFGPELGPADIVTTLAQEAATQEEFRLRGQSPPCYL